ncbi:MAG: hypothetical protein GF418_13095, partial [Chitinivibrionales bacterium]|nr:hypothetical protein [Chitinivibrionales bacterium]MBD3396555.1 hypothetical protein [Chitinivibrionales bacterium]
ALCICLAFPARALDVYTPAEGDSYEPGDIINVTWDASADMPAGAVVQLSVDAGLNWILMSQGEIIQPADPGWADFNWTIPDTLTGVPSQQCLVRVADYFDFANSAYSGTFTIGGTQGPPPDPTPVTIRLRPMRQFCEPGDTVRFAAAVHNADGQYIAAELGWSVSGGGAIGDKGLFTSDGTEGSFSIGVACISDPTISSSATVDVYGAELLLLSPAGGEVYQVGQTMAIEWAADPAATGPVILEFSPDDGLPWYSITVSGAVSYTSPLWGAYPWEIPAEMQGNPTVSASCKVQVLPYNNPATNAVSPGVFSVIEPVAETVGTEGGTVTLADVASLDVPAGARKPEDEAEEIGIVQTRTSVAPPAGFQLEKTGDVFVFLPHGTEFNDPVTISIPYSGSKDDVKILRRSDEDASVWEVIEDFWFDDANAPGRVFFETTTFSVYAASHEYEKPQTASRPARGSPGFHAREVRVRHIRNAIQISFPLDESHRVVVYRLDGSELVRLNGQGRADYILPCAHWSAGCCLVSIRSVSQEVSTRVMLVR